MLSSRKHGRKGNTEPSNGNHPLTPTLSREGRGSILFPILCFLFSAVVLLTPVATAAWADHDPEELGHYWEVPACTGEIHLQIVAMAAVVLLAWVGSRMMRAWRSRRVGG